MINVGVISDTHGLLRPEAVTALQGVDSIIHAGDIGSPDIVRELLRIAPLHAIRGNVDTEPWANAFPVTDVVQFGSVLLYVLHDLKTLDLNPHAAGFAAVISGHSHQPGIENREGVLYFNPGSAGPRRFNLPISLGKICIGNDGLLHPELIPLAI